MDEERIRSESNNGHSPTVVTKHDGMEEETERRSTEEIGAKEEGTASENRRGRSRRKSIGATGRLFEATHTTPMTPSRYFAALTFWSIFACFFIVLWTVILPLVFVLLVLVLVFWFFRSHILALVFEDEKCSTKISFSDFVDYSKITEICIREKERAAGVSIRRVTSDLPSPPCVKTPGAVTVAHSLIAKGGPQDAPIIVLLHGTASTSTSSYLHLIPDLLREFSEVHALDLPGFGASHYPPQYRRRVRGAHGRRRRRCCCWCFWCCCCQGSSRQCPRLEGTSAVPENSRRLASEDVRDTLATFVLDYIRLVVKSKEDRRQVVLLGHSIGSFIAVEAARIDLARKTDERLVSKLILASLAGAMPILGGMGMYWSLAFFSGFPIRQLRWLGRVWGGKHVLYTLGCTLGLDTIDMFRLRTWCESSAWLADLPSWFCSIDFAHSRWLDVSLLRLLRVTEKIPTAIIQGGNDQLIPNHYVDKVAECIWTEHFPATNRYDERPPTTGRDRGVWLTEDKAKATTSRETLVLYLGDKSTDRLSSNTDVESDVGASKTCGERAEKERTRNLSALDVDTSTLRSYAPVIYLDGVDHNVQEYPVAFVSATKLAHRVSKISGIVGKRFADNLLASALHPSSMRLGSLLGRPDTFRSPFLKAGADEGVGLLYKLIDDELSLSRGDSDAHDRALYHTNSHLAIEISV